MYELFKRSCTSWEEFSAATKVHVDFVETEEEARQACLEFNNNRTPQQVSAGTKVEYTRCG